MHQLLQIYNKVNHFGRALNMSLEVVRPGEVKYTMPISEMHLSSPSAVHGGAVSALMDAILGVAALSKSVESNRLVSTVEFKINYFKPVKPGDVLIGHGKIDFEGSRLIAASGEIIEKTSGVLLAKGIGTFNQYPADRINLEGRNDQDSSS